MKRLPIDHAADRASLGGRLVTATVDRIDDDGVVHVAFGETSPVPVRIAVPPGVPAPALARGSEVVVLVEADREAAPVIVSTILARLPAAPARIVELAADERIVLRCGAASIELAADGTIVLHGDRIESHAEGIQRIKGAQVRIN